MPARRCEAELARAACLIVEAMKSISMMPVSSWVAAGFRVPLLCSSFSLGSMLARGLAIDELTGKNCADTTEEVGWSWLEHVEARGHSKLRERRTELTVNYGNICTAAFRCVSQLPAVNSSVISCVSGSLSVYRKGRPNPGLLVLDGRLPQCRKCHSTEPSAPFFKKSKRAVTQLDSGPA